MVYFFLNNKERLRYCFDLAEFFFKAGTFDVGELNFVMSKTSYPLSALELFNIESLIVSFASILVQVESSAELIFSQKDFEH